MYENNVTLVKAYEKIANEQQDMIIMNTEAMTKMKSVVYNNLFCPIVRKETKQQEIDR